jgi:hypothetical protein
MKTLTTAIALTAILATSAVAKTERTRPAHTRVNNVVSHNSVSPRPVAQFDSYCHFNSGETDPDPRIRLQLARDCRDHDLSDGE